MEDNQYYRLEGHYDGIARRVQQVALVSLGLALLGAFGADFVGDSSVEEAASQAALWAGGAYGASLLYRWVLLTQMNGHPLPGDLGAHRRLLTGFYTKGEV